MDGFRNACRQKTEKIKLLYLGSTSPRCVVGVRHHSLDRCGPASVVLHLLHTVGFYFFSFCLLLLRGTETSLSGTFYFMFFFIYFRSFSLVSSGRSSSVYPGLLHNQSTHFFKFRAMLSIYIHFTLIKCSKYRTEPGNTFA